jgi:hypothetical protein
MIMIRRIACMQAVFSNSGMSLKRGDLGGWGVRVDRVEKREV